MAARWNHAGNGSWITAGNWSPSAVPNSGDVVLDFSLIGIAAGSYAVSIGSGENYALATLTIDSSATGGASGIALTLANASLNLSGTFTAAGRNNAVTETNSSFIGANASFGNSANSLTDWSLKNLSTAKFNGLVSGSGVNFTFGDSTADRLIFGTQGNSFAGAISQFQGNNSIDLTSLTYFNGAFSAVQNGGSLEIDENGMRVMVFASFTFQGATAADVIFSNDGSGGTALTVCFAAGTRILTDHGKIAVEDLRPGDLVATLDAGAQVLAPVRWIGRRRLDLARHPHPWAVAPVRIRAGAFADGLPHRDLVVSPDHAMLVDGQLLPARQLINQMSIAQLTGLARVEYFHVELDRHSILLAEGLPTESYLDTGNRGFFGNAEAPLILHPNPAEAPRAPAKTAFCLKFMTEPEAARQVWQRLHDRAVASGLAAEPVATTRDAELRVLAGGRVFLPVCAPVCAPMSGDAQHYLFALPGGLGSARLVSRRAPANGASPWLDDRRLLGVAIERIGLSAADGVTELAMDHPGLSPGWWDAERHGTRLQRWTDGDATIPLPGGPVLLELTVVGTTDYKLDKPGILQAA